MTNETLLTRPPDPHTPTVACDLEGTLMSETVWSGMYDYLLATGRTTEAKRFTRVRIPKYIWIKIFGGNLRQFKNDWMRDMLRLFKGYSKQQFDELCEFVVENQIWPNRRAGVVAELEAHLAAGRRVLLVTGMYEPLLVRLIERIPGLEAIGTPLVWDGDIFTGEIALDDFSVGVEKRNQLEAFAPAGGKIYAAYGDTYTDHHMLSFSENPVAVVPDKRLAKLAREKGWRVMVGS